MADLPNNHFAERALEEIARPLRELAPAPRMLLSFPGVALHMMVTFYLTLLLVAIAAGESGSSPSLMAFILIWHAAAIPAWFLRSLCLRLCSNSFGLLLFFTAILLLVYMLQGQISIGIHNILTWIQATQLGF